MKSPIVRGIIGVAVVLAVLAFLRFGMGRSGNGPGSSGGEAAGPGSGTAANTSVSTGNGSNPNKTPQELLGVGFLPVT